MIPAHSKSNLVAGSGTHAEKASIRADFFSLIVLKDLHEVEQLEDDWRRISEGKMHAFQSFAWNLAWSRHYESQYEELAVFVLRRNGAAIGILPCVRNGNRLRLIGDELCDFQDAIVAEGEDAGRLITEVFSLARENKTHFDFRKLSKNGVLWPVIRQVCEKSGFSLFHKRYGSCPWFRLDGSNEEFLRRSKASLRKRIRRALRRLEDLAPEHSYRLLESHEITEKTVADLGALHSRNQHRKEGASIFDEDRYRAFLTEAAGNSEVGMKVIEIRDRGGDLIAFDLGFESGPRFYAYLGAFEEAFSMGSPGMCLLNWQMDIFPLRGVTDYDFLCGEESYKFDYATETYDIISTRIYARGFRSQLILGGMRWIRSVKMAIKPLLLRSGLL